MNCFAWIGRLDERGVASGGRARDTSLGNLWGRLRKGEEGKMVNSNIRISYGSFPPPLFSSRLSFCVAWMDNKVWNFPTEDEDMPETSTKPKPGEITAPLVCTISTGYYPLRSSARSLPYDQIIYRSSCFIINKKRGINYEIGKQWVDKVSVTGK